MINLIDASLALMILSSLSVLFITASSIAVIIIGVIKSRNEFAIVKRFIETSPVTEFALVSGINRNYA